jgi:hypothetical protein
MADISKCQGTGCTLKESCYRFTAKTNSHWQSYGGFCQDPETGECEHYWVDLANLYYEPCRPIEIEGIVE